MINILFGGNYKVFDGILLCVMSITKNTKEALNVFILTADVTELNPQYKPIKSEDVLFLNNYLKQKNKHSKATLIKLGSEFNEWIHLSKNQLNTYTPFAFLRLFSDTIKELPKKIIYLDTDIMVPGNIKELFNIDINDYELAAVRDLNGQWFIGANYFNSGVLLMNLKKIKETNLLQKVKQMCLTKKMAFPDQSALNKLTTKIKYLPRKFNEQHKLKKDTIIQHFCKRIKWLPFFKTQNIKQWQIDDVQNVYKIHAYDDIYEEFAILKDMQNIDNYKSVWYNF